ncbi:hypothetical protein [Streptomyces longwoodensis]|uniref:hypothetical protein n=1 Tax=Streptomyces longwoodensis TaxID=68231 RepID=UPI0036E95157
MSAVTSPLPATPGPLPTAPGRPTALARDLRWLLRLHRPTLYIWAALVVVLAAALLWLAGPLTDASADAWRDYNACRDGGRCSYYQDAILRYKDVYSYTTLALTALPFLVAAWSGAALIGRELESGTAHLAWTQGVSPARWLAVKLAAPAVLVSPRAPGCWSGCTTARGRRRTAAWTRRSPGTTASPCTPTARPRSVWPWPGSRSGRWRACCGAVRCPRW